MDNLEFSPEVTVKAYPRFPFKLKEYRDIALRVFADECKSSKGKKKKLLSKMNLINIRIVTNLAIRKMNRTYFGIDAPTDVISFSYLDDPEVIRGQKEDDAKGAAGDVMVSYEMAGSQCKLYKNSFPREIALYIIHGILHVFGYDDINALSKKKMWSKQDHYMKKYEDILDNISLKTKKRQ